jgi:ribosome-associated toxin RatA of RatAB toxin-antitoxin module
MPFMTLSQVIEKPVSEVFHAVIDVANFPKWNPTTASARKLSEGKIREGSRFELEIKGFGKTLQELQEFKRNEQVRLVPHISVLSGGHRFRFTDQGSHTRVDHELEMTPKGFFKLFSPFMGMIGRKNLRRTADALQKYLEGSQLLEK